MTEILPTDINTAIAGTTILIQYIEHVLLHAGTSIVYSETACWLLTGIVMGDQKKDSIGHTTNSASVE